MVRFAGGAILFLAAVDGCLAVAAGGDVALGRRLFAQTAFARPGAELSCLTCHPEAAEGGAIEAVYRADTRSRIPARDDRQETTLRNSPALHDTVGAEAEGALLHYDGEFTTAEALVKETWMGRNFGWLPAERDEARQQLTRAARSVEGAPVVWMTSGDETVANEAARAVVAFVRTLQFSRDAQGRHNGSAYDAFLRVNRLPLAPMAGQSAAEYGARLGERAAALRAPQQIVDAKGVVRFGELERRGMRIFFRGAIGAAQTSGAGNCAECHVPPSFTDAKFHNTGATQDEFDAVHGASAFAGLAVPTLAERNRDPQRWLPATFGRPDAAGPFSAVVQREQPGRTDLGVWNVYANPDFPAPQRALGRLLDPAGERPAAAVLELALARFKTTTVRNLGATAPYFHTGRARTIEDTIEFYRQMSDLAREGRMRNPPPEYFQVRLAAEDVAPLAAFLRALDEGFEPAGEATRSWP